MRPRVFTEGARTTDARRRELSAAVFRGVVPVPPSPTPTPNTEQRLVMEADGSNWLQAAVENGPAVSNGSLTDKEVRLSVPCSFWSSNLLSVAERSFVEELNLIVLHVPELHKPVYISSISENVLSALDSRLSRFWDMRIKMNVTHQQERYLLNPRI